MVLKNALSWPHTGCVSVLAESGVKAASYVATDTSGNTDVVTDGTDTSGNTDTVTDGTDGSAAVNPFSDIDGFISCNIVIVRKLGFDLLAVDRSTFGINVGVIHAHRPHGKAKAIGMKLSLDFKANFWEIISIGAIL